jgi:hypothetical protein
LLSTESIDTDGDGIGDNADLDDDGDGISDIDEALNLRVDSAEALLAEIRDLKNNIVLLKGATGDTGATGPQGNPGVQGVSGALLSPAEADQLKLDAEIGLRVNTRYDSTTLIADVVAKLESFSASIDALQRVLVDLQVGNTIDEEAP